MKNLFLLIIFLFFISCKNDSAMRMVDTAGMQFLEMRAQANPDFRKGWEDGCEVGIASGGNTFYKSFSRSNQVDGYKMAGSPAYKKAWSYSYWYCYRYTHIKNQSSIWGAWFTGYR